MRIRALLATWLLAACGAADPEAPAAGDPMDMSTMAHGDHAPRYGGFVFMHGDLHFEVVLDFGGEHRLYFSDAMRGELPAAVVEDVRVTVRRPDQEPEPLRPVIDDFGEAWIAVGEPVDAEGTVADVYFRFEGAPYSIEVPFVMDQPMVDPHAGMEMPTPS